VRATPAVQKWPDTVWLVRHGQSAGNVARDAAEAAGHHLIDLATRDVDVPLSPLGEQQSRALADWFPEHVRVMDQGLARWLIQRQLGGSPVVLQRRPAAVS